MRTISTNQAQKEVIINENFKAVEQAGMFAWRVQGTSGLQFGYWGGNYQDAAGNLKNFPDGTITVNASATNYVYLDSATTTIGVITTIPTQGQIRLAKVVTNATAITSVTDERLFAFFPVGTPNKIFQDPYTLPVASQFVLGGVKVDGVTTFIDGNGVLSAAGGGGGGGVVAVANPFEEKYIYMAKAMNNATTMTEFGADFTHGTLTTVAFTPGTFAGEIPYKEIRTTATSGNTNGILSPGAVWYRSGIFSIKKRIRLVITQSTLQSSVIAGLHASSNATYSFSDFTGLTDFIGMGYRNADTNLQLIYMNNSNVLTLVDLGTSFPCREVGAVYDLIITSDRADNTKYTISIVRQDVSQGYSETVTSAYPSSTVPLMPKVGIKNNEALLKSVGLSSIYMEVYR